MVRAACLGLGALVAGAAQPAAACRLALALALDVSSSVDATEDALQRGGLAAALVAPDVQAAFLDPGEPVALAVYEWSGRQKQVLLQDWALIRSAADLRAVSARIAASSRSHDDFPTALGYALGFGATLLGRAPDCAAATLDVSGDGENNEGFGPRKAQAAFPFDGVTVNGLVVRATPTDGRDDLVAYYRDAVIHGPGAFVEVAGGFADFERAMRAKLIRELGVVMIGDAG
ncbi:MAG: DUF1194 domain-containing protein [Salibaculum sp.]|uniref:DUF1194 domain-containing protein n=1 Tax=Salibaculum sp. TaxID=2855480 RepID=UPI00287071F0|nr:DUF1194 domain-containing protein [Salibaculum sp.]MDR9428890.1 DUF1194 domain-containing protein [Salibaculum sp.]MDR9481963.1 DUF1194 domain-containing protein [Salibaculum sp.]